MAEPPNRSSGPAARDADRGRCRGLHQRARDAQGGGDRKEGACGDQPAGEVPAHARCDRRDRDPDDRRIAERPRNPAVATRWTPPLGNASRTARAPATSRPARTHLESCRASRPGADPRARSDGATLGGGTGADDQFDRPKAGGWRHTMADRVRQGRQDTRAPDPARSGRRAAHLARASRAHPLRSRNPVSPPRSPARRRELSRRQPSRGPGSAQRSTTAGSPHTRSETSSAP